MNGPYRATTRRDLLIASSTCALGAVTAVLPVSAQEKPAVEVKPDAPEAWQSAMRAITGDAKLVERTANDSYWGDGGDGSGTNRLGQILMLVREELRPAAEKT